MKTLASALFLLAVLICPISGLARTTSIDHTIESEVFADQRLISVFEPNTEFIPASDAYPTIYLFDAQYEPYLDAAVSQLHYLMATGKVLPAYIVGVHTKHRPKEFTPEARDPRTPDDWGETPVGQAGLLEQHLRKEVFPLIEGTYPVNPLRIGVGHSLGGTFVLNNAFESNDLFRAIVAVSPNMAYDYRVLGQKAKEALAQKKRNPSLLFVSAGNVGGMENSFRMAIEACDSLMKAQAHPHFDWTYAFYEGYNHMNTPIRTILEGMEHITSKIDISDDQLAACLNEGKGAYLRSLQQVLAERDAWLGFQMHSSADEWNDFGYFAGYDSRWAPALEVFDHALKLFPEDANLYDSRGEALLNLERFDEAVASYQKAMEVLEAHLADYSEEEQTYLREMFEQNIEAAMQAKADARP